MSARNVLKKPDWAKLWAFALGLPARLPQRGSWRRRLLNLMVALVAIFSIFLVADKRFPLPPVETRGAQIILAEDGSPLWRFADKNGIWRYPVRSDEVSPEYIEALFTFEDRWFYYHPGINPVAMFRALRQNVVNGRIVSGGSTLTMQVARIIDPHDRSIPGKLRQMWRTLQLEWHYSKKEILTIYLNRAPFGGTLEGIGAASWAYLDKPPSKMTYAEAALMAALPQSPSRLRPDRHGEAARAARDKVLRRMTEFNAWPVERVTEALEEPVLLSPRKEPQLAPLLARRLALQSSQSKIRTNIDVRAQLQLEALLKSWKTRLPERSSAAIIVIEHQTMAVRAYLGSMELDDNKRFGHIDMVHAVRSPGSTLKPFLYAMAIDDGLIHSESLLQDAPRRYGDYRPDNFSTGFSGPVSASGALYRSLNLPAVQLLEVYGPKRFTGNLYGAGLPLQLPEAASPSLAVILGGSGSRLEDLTAAYSIFARKGMLAKARILPSDELKEKRLISPESAWIIRTILSGQLQPGPNNAMDARTLAWKTGTSYGFRDAWAIGVGPRYLVGVWVGRPDGTPVAGQYGAISATPLLQQAHNILLSRDQQRAIPQPLNPQPLGVTEASICWPTGQPMATNDPNCRSARRAWTREGVTPPTLQTADQAADASYLTTVWLNAKGKRVDSTCASATETRIALWPAVLEPWLAASERRAARLPAPDNNCPPIGQIRATPLVIAGVRDGEALRRPGASQDELSLKISALGGAGQRWWFLDGNALNSTFEHGELTIIVRDRGQHQLSVLDETGQSASTTFKLID